MVNARNRPVAVATSQAVLLVALATSAGVRGPGWIAAITCSAVVSVGVARGLARFGHTIGPADLVTLTRATLACAVAALVADALAGRPVVVPLTTLVVVALILDAVDGLVARRTRSASRFGAQFDGEVDAFLLLVLSVYVADDAGGWVLLIGLARYAFAACGRVLPWLRGQLPPRYWRKVVTAVQGIVLALAAAGLLPDRWTQAALVVALALLAESFGRDVLWLRQRRRTERAEPAVDAGRAVRTVSS